MSFAVRPAFADVGLIIEGASGEVGFWSDMGHSAVWVSRACVDEHGRVYFCEGGKGVVLSGTPAWVRPGAAAIPADDYFLGPDDTPGANEEAAWGEALAAMYPAVAATDGEKYLGRAWVRETRVLVFHTTTDQDRAAIERVERQRNEFQYRAAKNNCSDYTVAVLRLWLGDRLRTRRWSDAEISTPRGVERGLVDSLGNAPHGELQTFYFPQPKHWKDRRPARDICEAGLFDPKYAALLILQQPTAYIGLAGCFGYTRVSTWVREWRRPRSGDAVGKVKGKTPEEVLARMSSGVFGAKTNG